jgi:hypothetical protein
MRLSVKERGSSLGPLSRQQHNCLIMGGWGLLYAFLLVQFYSAPQIYDWNEF